MTRTHTYKNSSSKVSRFNREWKQTDGWTDATDCFTLFPIKAVGKHGTMIDWLIDVRTKDIVPCVCVCVCVRSYGSHILFVDRDDGTHDHDRNLLLQVLLQKVTDPLS